MSSQLKRLAKIEQMLEGLDKRYVFKVVFSAQEQDEWLSQQTDNDSVHLSILKLYD